MRVSFGCYLKPAGIYQKHQTATDIEPVRYETSKKSCKDYMLVAMINPS